MKFKIAKGEKKEKKFDGDDTQPIPVSPDDTKNYREPSELLAEISKTEREKRKEAAENGATALLEDAIDAKIDDLVKKKE